MSKTYSAKPTDVKREWYLVDASETTLGRLASRTAQLLTGKGKPMFTPHIDTGDYVVVINADKLIVTGNKLEEKKYYRHSQYPGSLKETKLRHKLAADPVSVVEEAVRGMLPKNKLSKGRLQRLKVYSGEEHQHEAQKPKKLSVKEGK